MSAAVRRRLLAEFTGTGLLGGLLAHGLIRLLYPNGATVAAGPATTPVRG